MAVKLLGRSYRTKSGLFVRAEAELGLLTYSPFTGLTYAVHPSNAEDINLWLNFSCSEPPSEVFKASLGAGWDVPLEEGKQLHPQLLPTANAWNILPLPEKPILINWFLTGRCPLACKYCWAEDLMRQEHLEPGADEVRRIAQVILSYQPLVIVLTGGDPLFSPFLPDAIKALAGKCGIVIDTSGYTLNSKHLELFREHNVSVRISLDAERPKVNQAQRPLYSKYPSLPRSGKGTTEAAVEAICKCLDAGLSVTVQSVATKKTANDLLSLGDKLYRMGVRSWRVGKVAPSEARMDGYRLLIGSMMDDGRKVKGKKSQGPYEFIFNQLRDAYANSWHHSMAVQVMHNNIPNAVVLVGPDGIFYTESNVGIRKVILDTDHPKSPSAEAIRSRVNLSAHAERYLNLTTP